jgi:membrane-bound lytic murein transglycosylase D
VRAITALIALLLCVPLTAQAQQSAPGDVAGIEALPPSQIPISLEARLPRLDRLERATSGDAVLTRIAQVYEVQARMLEAAAAGDEERVETLLDASMDALQEMIATPGTTERPRFRELYRTVLTEYERYFGVPADTLSLPYGDIYAARTELFDAMNEVEEPLLENVTFPALGPVATSVPMTMNRLVDQSIAYLLRSPERHLYHWISRSETYFPMIERVLREEGVPDELKYLAMIESGLNPRARSWAAANGMWQFIAATGRAYDLQVNSWVDERMDPEKATRAAARHLKDLHRMFGGDWQLALAGYNCSPSRIRRALARAESRLGRRPTFWDIYNDIPRETRNYVPMFIAAALVTSNPDAFDVDMSQVKPAPEYAYHYVPVRGFLSIDEIAGMTGTDAATIQALNPELRRSQIPPSTDGYYVRIPIGSYDHFAEAYAELPEEKRQSTVAYVVKRGDALGKIARQYGVSVSQLMTTNGLRSTTIQIGQRLVVPVPSYDSSPLLADVQGEEVVTVEYGRTRTRPILAASDVTRTTTTRPETPVVTASTASTPPAREPEAADPAGAETKETESETPEAPTRIVYSVQRGDNLTEIAKKYGVSLSELRSWNRIQGSRIQVGQRLYLYDENPSSTSAGAERSTTLYQVRRGDTLSEIADRHGVRQADLRQWNNLRSSTIRVGQRLTIHGASSGAATIYRVQRGDSLYVIARKHGVSIEDIKRWNSLTSSRLLPGQELKINS